MILSEENDVDSPGPHPHFTVDLIFSCTNYRVDMYVVVTREFLKRSESFMTKR